MFHMFLPITPFIFREESYMSETEFKEYEMISNESRVGCLSVSMFSRTAEPIKLSFVSVTVNAKTTYLSSY